jgi:uncharacterized protein (TIGR02145 family)
LKKFILSSLVAICIYLISNAQPPQAFNYQTVVMDNGNPVANTTVSFRISILKNNQNGNAVYIETQSPTTNEFGLVNLQIGNGTIVSGKMDSISWGTDKYYIKTEIDITGSTNYVFMGTSQLLSVPYALYAGKSGNPLGGDNIEAMTEAERNLISNPPQGMAVFNITTGCLNYYKNTTWSEVCGSSTFAQPVASSNGAVCEGKTLKLFSTTVTGASYKWTGPNNFISNVQNPSIPNVTLDAAGTYTVTAYNGNNYRSNSTIVTIKYLASIANAGPDQLNVSGVTTTLAGNVPVIGNGIWSLVSGIAGQISSPQNPSSTFTGRSGSTYTLRWSISNDCDTTTDDVIISFAPIQFYCSNNLLDTRDNQYYGTVQIGTQCWMKQNLNIGTRINLTSSQTDNGIIEKYCYNNIDNNCTTVGGLYQWNEMMQYFSSVGSQGICPIGWHIPSDADWFTLENFVDPTITNPQATGYLGTDCGSKLKEAGTAHWTSPNTGATNSSGFTALPGGVSYPTAFYEMNGSAYFWSSDPGSRSCRALAYSSPKIYNASLGADKGNSVRCVKD